MIRAAAGARQCFAIVNLEKNLGDSEPPASQLASSLARSLSEHSSRGPWKDPGKPLRHKIYFAILNLGGAGGGERETSGLRDCGVSMRP